MSLLINHIQTVFKCPDDFTADQRILLAELIMVEIRKMTKRSLDVDGAPFAEYSESYKESTEFEIAGKTSKVNLTLTGDMLASMELITHIKGQVRIGYKKTNPEAGKVQGNQSGIRGNSMDIVNPRPFLGLPEPVLKSLYNKVRLKTAVKINEDLDKVVKKLTGF